MCVDSPIRLWMAFLTKEQKQPKEISGKGKDGAVTETSQSDSMLRANRRKFITGGLAAAPIIAATLSNRSALAYGGWGGGCTVSGLAWQSANTSNHDESGGGCACTPDWWHGQQWPNPGDNVPGGYWPDVTRHGTKFSHKFGKNYHRRAPSGGYGKTHSLNYRREHTDPYFGDTIAYGGGQGDYMNYPNSTVALPGQAVTALLNAYFWGRERFGLSPQEVISKFREYAGASRQENDNLNDFFRMYNEQEIE